MYDLLERALSGNELLPLVIKVAMSHSTWKMYCFINSDNFDATDLRF